MIAVIGSPRLVESGPEARAGGLAVSIAAGAAKAGARVEVVGKLGDDPAGDALLLSLAREGIGHVAMLRDPGRPTPVVAAQEEAPDGDAVTASAPPVDGPGLEAADVGLALRYLPELQVIVAVHLTSDVLAEAVAATSWAETSLIVAVPADTAASDGPWAGPADALTVAVDDEDDSGAGAAIGRYAAALDGGQSDRAAFDALLAAIGTPAGG